MSEKTTKSASEAVRTSTVAFSPEQMELVQQLISASKEPTNERGQSAISRFTDVRDPKEIMTCPVYRFDGKFVIGFKDLNQDPYRKAPKYSEAKLDINRGLKDQPFVTLLLSNDGVNIQEKEVPLIDYVNNRMKVEIPKGDFEIKSRDVIRDYGIIGRGGGGAFAQDVAGSGQPITPMKVKAETKETERTFIVKLPGFEKPVTYIEAFLA